MSTHYRQLTLAQRYQIWSLRDTGYKLRAIGEKVGVDFSTVSRELRRNRSINGYKPQLAHKKSIDRKTTAKKSNKHTDKLVLVYHLTRQGMKRDVEDYIRYYNRDRLHTANNNVSPVEYELSQIKVSG